MKILLIILCIFICFFLIYSIRKRQLIHRIRRMDSGRKIDRLREIARPLGFTYLPDNDILTSTHDAWQREFGYMALFDRTAPHFNMIFDCEPIYFDHDGRTWLIEFWKGQYGINTGCEVGIYYADSVMEPAARPHVHFRSVSDGEMLPIQMELLYQDRVLFSVWHTHWWLTGFRMGVFSRPEDLSMRVTLTFPDYTMLQSFIGGLLEAGYRMCRLCISDLTVSFEFCTPYSVQPRHEKRISVAFSQWKNRQFCRLYLFVTHPFTDTADRLLYLYYLIPSVFRRMLRFRRCRP